MLAMTSLGLKLCNLDMQRVRQSPRGEERKQLQTLCSVRPEVKGTQMIDTHKEDKTEGYSA